MTILTSVRHLIVLLISISLIISDAEYIFTCLLVIYLLWRNVYLGLPPFFFNLGFLLYIYIYIYIYISHLLYPFIC